MNNNQVAHLTVEQRELRALARQTVDIVQFMTRESCECGIQALLPLVQEAVGASEVTVPEGLDEKTGMDLIETILQRRHQQRPDEPKKKEKLFETPKVVAPPSVQKKRERLPSEKVKTRSQGPPRKQSKSLVEHHNNDNNNDDDDEWEDWDPDTHGSIAGVIRMGVHNGTFGLFITARKNGSGHRAVFRFFADADTLKAVDLIEDKNKFRKTVKILLEGIQQCIGDDDDNVSHELEALLKTSKWGQQVLSQLSNSDSNHNDDRE